MHHYYRPSPQSQLARLSVRQSCLILVSAILLGSCSSSDNTSTAAPTVPPVVGPDPLAFCSFIGPDIPEEGIDAPGLPGFTQLAAGQASATQELTLVGGMTQSISFEQRCAMPGPNDGCCELYIYHMSDGACQMPLSLLTDPGSNRVGALFEQSDESTVSARFYGESACAYSSISVDTVATASTVDTLSADGQRLRHTDVEVQTVGGITYFSDISRRANLDMGGMMGDKESIDVMLFQDYAGAGAFDSRQTQISIAQGSAPEDTFVRTGLDALAYTQIVYDFFLEELSSNSYDDEGSSMNAVVEVATPFEDFVVTCDTGEQMMIERGSDVDNAFSVFGTGTIGFTPPGGSQGRGLSVSLDVVAHEWGHSFLDARSSLVYERESGALNEAFADWTAIRVSDIAGRTDWIIGNDIYEPGHPRFEFAQQNLMRDLSVPRSVNDDAWLPVDDAGCGTPNDCNDQCGVHENNGVPNHMFYLLSDGGSNQPVGAQAAIDVVGIGLEKAFLIAVAANSNFWTMETDFAAARTGMEMAAMSLFPEEEATRIEIGRAWAAVGVGSAPSRPSAAAVTAKEFE